MTFNELRLSEPLLRAIASEGYSTPTPIQFQAIPHLLAGADLLGCAQTGTGKTAAFALPILHRLHESSNRSNEGSRRPRALVIAPTRELTLQIAESFVTYGRHLSLRHTAVVGGVSQVPQVRALQRGVDVLVATPGRLVDLLQQGYIDLRSIETFVADEADRMLDMGFLPDLQRIIARLPAERQNIMFSATIPAEIEQLANKILRQPVRIRIVSAQTAAQLVEQSVCFVPKKHKSSLLAQFLTTKPVTRAIVFTRTKRGADRVAQQLNRAGIRAEAMHGDKSQSARQRTLTSFKSSRPPILVATDVAARGIDVDGVSHVFNFDLPIEPETYVHRIGRTGRAGATGMAVSFCDQEERTHLKAIERLLRRTLTVESHGEFELPAQETRPPVSPRNAAPPRRGPATHFTGRPGSATHPRQRSYRGRRPR